MNSTKFCISGDDRSALRKAHYRAMLMIPEEVSGIDHFENSFIIDSNIETQTPSKLTPFLRWCENLGEVEIEVVSDS